MSYPDKEKPMNGHSEQMENAKNPMENAKKKTKKKPKSSLKELSKDLESRLPIGKLKWSKSDEEDLDTQTNLGIKDKEKDSPAVDVSKHPDEPSPAIGQLKQKADEDSTEKADSPKPVDHFDKASAKQVEQKLEEEQRTGKHQSAPSLEDTLTPIDFKEYSIDPLPEPKEKHEYQTEVKKPAFSVEQDWENNHDDSYSDDGNPDISEGSGTGKNVVKWAVKILWLPVLLFVVLIVSLIIGHTFIGDQPAGDVFDIEMWEHIYNLIYG
ncbi:DNA-directed RNA polymerase subunit beta [Paenactinomyces guangxiensis]|uniref:DNA-directed RNA polymerase subunit beta n=1 Tax=Paenactinomyces guangxiensis TaxID=1490290 RepID=A0A7W2A9Q2_9BACL|nr:DNA-directed RNA polymerase subunit beta [Paenactinomyces guangxiensis]MBA4495980.1 DNA-directed RNA polymerase subunit beta [Paenactinomyces guangxiensis]MBH8593033.1 DNA-directed RNA polymerase subunit beta [Paenactinomyces guangxiensis]